MTLPIVSFHHKGNTGLQFFSYGSCAAINSHFGKDTPFVSVLYEQPDRISMIPPALEFYDLTVERRYLLGPQTDLLLRKVYFWRAKQYTRIGLTAPVWVYRVQLSK